MATSAETSKADQDEFAKSFNEDQEKAPQKTEDEEFGLTEVPEDDVNPDDSQGAGAPAGEPEPSPPAPSVDEQRLSEWEARLKAKEAELAQREAASSTSNVNDAETDKEVESPGDDGSVSLESEGGDPAAQLAEDFGDDFVQLITKLVTNICKKHVGESDNGIAATVNELIEDLRTERQANHFKSIKAQHDDFIEITESPEFGQWIGSISPDEQRQYQRVIDSGTAEEVIDMLTAYKAAHSNKDADSGFDDDSLSAAEGVRSGGMKLPSAPSSNQDYEAAWNAA